jgi:hypothetical protein
MNDEALASGTTHFDRDGARAIRAELDGCRDAARRKSGARGDAALAWAARRRGRTLAGEWRHLFRGLIVTFHALVRRREPRVRCNKF